MKHIAIIIFYISLTFSFQGFAQEHSFSIEDVQNHKEYNGKFQKLPSKNQDFRLIRVDNSPYTRRDSKFFKKLKKNYLVTLDNLKLKNNSPDTISFNGATYKKLKEDRDKIVYEEVNSSKFLVHQVEISYSNNHLERATFKRYNLHSNRQEDSYIIRFFSYK